MMKHKKLIGFGALAVAIAIVYTLFIQALSRGTTELVGTLPSPDGRYVAYTHAWTTDVTKLTKYSLTVAPEGQEVDSQQEAVYDGWMPFDLEWLSGSALFVKNVASIDSVQERRVDDVRITYSRWKLPDQPNFSVLQVDSVLVSPDGEHMAYLYSAYMGDVSYYGLVVLEQGKSFNYNETDDVYFSEVPFSAVWTDSATLYVDNAQEGPVYIQDASRENIRISYARLIPDLQGDF